jgi:hypothetical protein
MKLAAQRRPGGRSAVGAGAHGREEMEAAARRGSPSAESWQPALGAWEVGVGGGVVNG